MILTGNSAKVLNLSRKENPRHDSSGCGLRIEGEDNIYMRKEICALSFSEKERICENEFIHNGPYWHICTDGTRMQNIFCTMEDFNTGMWILASVRCMVTDCRVITFEIMGNHLHLITAGPRERCLYFFEILKSRLKRTFTRMGSLVDWNRFAAETHPIETLQALRNEIIYVNRNAFIANEAYTPDSYPWGGGCAYFNGWMGDIQPVPLCNLKINHQRELLHTRDIERFARLEVIGNRAFIPSFCDIALGERMFRDPRSYFNALTRNAETFSQIASRLKDTVFLTDDEMYVVTVSHISKEYGINKIPLLSPQQRLDTARHLHFNYNATKQQLRRILKLEIGVLDEMFPL